MQVIKSIFGRMGAKPLAIFAIFMLALVGSFGLGLALKQHTSAAIVRDSGHNPIDNANANGGVGAADAKELIADIKDGKPSDLATIYSHFGLSSDKYQQFINENKAGVVTKEGNVIVDGVTVMTDAQTYGRDKFDSHREATSFNGITLYHSAPQYSFASGVTQLPVMVMFDGNGQPSVVIMNACGNTVTGHPKTNSVSCTALNQTKTGLNDYSYTTNVSVTGNAKLSRIVYHFSDDNSTQTATSTTQVIKHTWKKSGTVTVTVYAKVPGDKEIKAADCSKSVTFVAPYYACVAVNPTALDSKKTQFRFTVMTSQGNGATLKDANFTLDQNNTTTGVTTKDSKGNIYKDYTFAQDGKTHTVVATVNFNVAGGIKSVTCQAPVTAGKTPMCTVPGKEQYPANSPECKPGIKECKPGIPVNDERCEETPPPTPPTTELPNTGAGDIFGLFAGTSALGAVGHRIIRSRRQR